MNKRLFRFYAACMGVWAISMGPSVVAQDFEFILSDTLWVNVTFYDFHENSNFGSGNCGTAPGQVQDTLDLDRKPVLLKDRCYNDLVGQWFRPSGGAGATFLPFLGVWDGLVNYKGREGEWVGQAFNEADQMANVVIYDSLPFTLIDSATGTYGFLRTNQAPGGGFFWLDGKGFGEEPAGSGHNFYFTMELHKEFIYQGGEYFQFRGDDDVWVFINGKLALDLGGMQAETKRALELDAIADELGLVKGETYPMDFFYTERKHPQSNCEITTNLLTPVRPKSLIVTTSPIPPDPLLTTGLRDTTLRVGETIPLYAYVFNDDNTLRTGYGDNVTWQFIGPWGVRLQPDTV
ncbi:MAG: fibro-slime domain-containing protein, partial [Chitinispirillaceae bacterium]|nr:fibro-slime domain-containing protein [Chitinispirillaceae bacterium]